MSLEQQLQNLPKPLLATLIIGIAIVLFMILEPPRTLCDTQAENFRSEFKGTLFAQKKEKRTYPPLIINALESCLAGRSSGSCYDYFNMLKKIAFYIKNAPRECASQLGGLQVDQYVKTEHYVKIASKEKTEEQLAKVTYGSASVQTLLKDGIRLMSVMAWGEKPPRISSERLGWLRESEVSIFCHLKDALVRDAGAEAWKSYEQKIMSEFPGLDERSAVEYLPSTQVRELSLFSISCANYR